MNQNQSMTMRGPYAKHHADRHASADARENRIAQASRGSRSSRDIQIARGARVGQDEGSGRNARAARPGQSGAGSSQGNPNDCGNRPGSNRGNGKKRIALVALLIAALALAVFGFSKCSQPSSIEEVTGGWFYDQTSTEIQEAIDHEVEDGYFNMSVNTFVPVSEGTALVGIKNIEENKFDCIVTITLEDGTQVYRSGGLTPGSELKYVTLAQDLPAGDYEATALFEIYEQDEVHTKAGQTASKITLHVQ